jgi:hypothetical protein
MSEELLTEKENKLPNFKNHHSKIKESIKSMFLFSVMESEVEKVAKGLKNKLSAGID